MTAIAFEPVWSLIYLQAAFVFGYFRSEFYPFSFPVGKSNVSIKCVSNMYEINKEITLDIRKNKNEKFISVLKCNESGLHRLNNNTKFEGVHILSFRDNCLFNHNWYNYIELTVSLQSDKCILGPQTSASWRCLFSNETYTFNSSEKDIYSIKGQSPKNMERISIVTRQTSKSLYETDDVLQLQCIGEVESINAMPSKDIRWCRKENGKFKLISFQDPPLTDVVERSKDGCTVVQNSFLFYHVSQNDTALEIMCESGWGYACGIHGINATLNIPTKDTKPDEWKMWPILIHDKKSLLNPEHIILDGLGKTIHLQCTASAYSNNSSLVRYINWCFKKEKKAKWAQVILQESEENASSNSGGKITYFSKIQYHVTVFDSDVHFLCEISKSQICGTGFTFVQTIVHVDNRKVKEGIRQQMSEEPENSTAVVAVLSGLLAFIVILKTLLLVVLFQRREIRLFGWKIRIDKIRKRKRTTEESFGNRSLPKMPELDAKETRKYPIKACSNPQQGKKHLVFTEGDVRQEVNSTYCDEDGYVAVNPFTG
eukprot:XP_011452166.2 PREDICTED: uncharacterized protein LOC105345649 isoform X2 [Crassostrea gigas]